MFCRCTLWAFLLFCGLLWFSIGEVQIRVPQSGCARAKVAYPVGVRTWPQCWSETTRWDIYTEVLGKPARWRISRSHRDDHNHVVKSVLYKSPSPAGCLQMCMCVLAQGPLFSTRRNGGVRKLKRKSLLPALTVIYPITPYSFLFHDFRTRETGTALFSSASAGAKRANLCVRGEAMRLAEWAEAFPGPPHLLIHWGRVGGVIARRFGESSRRSDAVEVRAKSPQATRLSSTTASTELWEAETFDGQINGCFSAPCFCALTMKWFGMKILVSLPHITDLTDHFMWAPRMDLQVQ